MFYYLLAAVIILGVMVMWYYATSARRRYIDHARRISGLSMGDARSKWLEVAKGDGNWEFDESVALSLNISHLENATPIIFKPVSLRIGGGDYKYTSRTTPGFRAIGTIGDDELAWICCRASEDSVWELDGTEVSDREIDFSKFPSVYHYLLFVHESYSGGRR